MAQVKTKARIEKVFQAPCRMPNGLQATPEGLWLVDQIDDDVYLVDETGKVLNRLMTESGNSSGLTYGGGALWVAVNGGPRGRPERPWDHHGNWVLKVSPKTGKTIASFQLPKEGGVHGLEWVRGRIWVTRPGVNILALYDARDFSLVREVSVPWKRLHGLAWDGKGLWAVHTADRIIVKYNVDTGKELDRIEVPPPNPEPHGLTLWNGVLWYCDAESGAVCRILRS